MRRRPQTADEAPGQDSFLDIVANLVGILIILVMIIGAQAKDAILHGNVPSTEQQTTAAEVDTARQQLATTQSVVQELATNLHQQEMEIAYRRAERDRLLTVIKAAEATLAEQQQQLSSQDQHAHQLHSEILLAEEALNDVKLSRAALTQRRRPVKVIEHRPTPLAETVFGQEVHFRLQDGRITYVPIDELVDVFKQEARKHVHKLRQTPRLTETVGPIGGFRLKYTLKRTSYSIETRAGAVSQQRVELDHFVLVPVRHELGEPVATALAAGSQFRSILSSYDPQQVTVTVWVYPDGFQRFRQVKETLQELGFLTAGRPLPAGQPISGSPNGSRSAAQ